MHQWGSIPGIAFGWQKRTARSSLARSTTCCRSPSQNFSCLWRSGVDVRLLVIGAVGWKCERVIEAISRHPELRRRLFWFKDLSDAELAYCYRHADGVVAASLAEGSGLPLIEALARGLPVVASNIAVFREIGGASACYFPVGDEAELAERVRTLLRHARPDARPIRWPG